MDGYGTSGHGCRSLAPYVHGRASAYAQLASACYALCKSFSIGLYECLISSVIASCIRLRSLDSLPLHMLYISMEKASSFGDYVRYAYVGVYYLW